MVLLAGNLPAAEKEGLTPLYGDSTLVAGSSEPGFRDGNFVKSAFRHPAGMALSSDKLTLYVADTDNHAIRAVALDRGNAVSSLTTAAGTGFSSPTEIFVHRSGVCLYVLDQGNLSVLDLASRQVTPLPDAVGASGTGRERIRASTLVYDPDKDLIYFADPGRGELNALFLQDLRLVHLGLLKDYSPVATRLALAGQTLCSYRKDLGTFNRLEIPTAGAFELREVALPLRIPGGEGFGGHEKKPGEWKVLLWDPDTSTLKWIDPRSSAVSECPLFDYQGQSLSRTASALPDSLPNTVVSKTALFRGPLRMLYEPGQGLYYVSESNSNQVVALRPQCSLMPEEVSNSKGLMDIEFPAEKPLGVTRVLLVTRSIGFKGAHNESMSRAARLATQLQLYLNLFSALDGSGKRFEVLFLGGYSTGMGGGTPSYLLGHQEVLGYYHVDEVLLEVGNFTLFFEATATQRTRSRDDIADPKSDPEWNLLPQEEKEKSYGPLTRELMAYARANGRILPDGRLTYPSNYRADPGFRDIALKMMDKVSGKIAEAAAKTGTRVSFALIPEPDLVGLREMPQSREASVDLVREPLRALAEKRHFGLVDISDEVRLVDPLLFPLGLNVGGDHFNEKGHQWVAFLLAKRFLEQQIGVHPHLTPEVP